MAVLGRGRKRQTEKCTEEQGKITHGRAVKVKSENI
jgi:hypothetical protein